MKLDVFVFFNICLICFECVMAAYMGSVFFQKRYRQSVYVLSVVALVVISNVLLFFFDGIAPLKLLIGLLLPMLWMCCVFKTSIIKALFTSALLLSYWTLIDSLFLMIVSNLWDGETIQVFSSPYAYYLLCFIAKGIELFGIVIVRVSAKDRLQVQAMAWSDWVRTLFFPFATLLVSLELLAIFNTSPELANKLLICEGILLSADIMSVFLLDYIEKQQIAVRNNALLKQNLKKEHASIASWISAYRDERKRSHDFQNQLSVLRGMADRQAPQDEFVQYLDRLLNVKFPATRYINTNRMVTDVVLSQKAALAREKNIAFRMQLDDLSLFPLTDDEFVVVLANLLDNAIEACEKIPEVEQRHISIKIQCAPEVSYLHIENSAATPVIIKNNRIIMNNRKSFDRGFGLQNVLTILERHGALYSMSYQDNDHTFCISAQVMTTE